VIASEIFDVTGSASGGGQSIPPDGSPVAVPLTGTTTFTPGAGRVSALAAGVEFTVATTNSAQACGPSVGVFVNGEQAQMELTPDPAGPPYATALETLSGYGADGPFGLINPGTPITITATLDGDSGNHCTADSKLNKVEIRIVQIR
jgi:hypothetical protein